MMQRLAIACIRWYQRKGTSLHDRCRFEPTCSEYMRLSIEKYGTFPGIWKGIKRIRRCRYPNGGTDYP